MFDAFLRQIGAAPTRAETYDDNTALAVLLVRVARADGSYDDVEVARIDAILAAHSSLSPAEVITLRENAETIEEAAPDTVRFTRILKDSVPHEERVSLVEALWDVIIADNHRNFEEDAFMRLVVHLLGVTDKESGLARQRVIARS